MCNGPYMYPKINRMIADFKVDPLGDVVSEPVLDKGDVLGGGAHGRKDEDTLFGI